MDENSVTNHKDKLNAVVAPSRISKLLMSQWFTHYEKERKDGSPHDLDCQNSTMTRYVCMFTVK